MLSGGVGGGVLCTENKNVIVILLCNKMSSALKVEQQTGICKRKSVCGIVCHYITSVLLDAVLLMSDLGEGHLQLCWGLIQVLSLSSFPSVMSCCSICGCQGFMPLKEASELATDFRSRLERDAISKCRKLQWNVF